MVGEMPVKIFFCYAQEDEQILNQLKSHLRLLERQGLIELWYDREISAGIEWEQDDTKHLSEAQIILLLVSPDFMNSDYCYSVMMQRAMMRYNQGEARVIPIILSRCDWKNAPFSKLQVIPKHARPITEWEDRGAAFDNIVTNIRRVVDELYLIQNTNRLLAAKASLTIDLAKKERPSR